MPTLPCPRRLGAHLLALAAATAIATSARAACAQTAADKAEAESLFDEAGQLLRAGDARAACPKLERSLRLDRGIGTLLFLAECYERVGRAASAWATFREAAAEAKAVGQTERERIASSRAKKLDAIVPRLRVDVPAGTLPEGAIVLRDERALDPATFGVAIAVDPGVHVVLITAPGHASLRLERTLDIGEEATLHVTPLTKSEPGTAPSGVAGATSSAASGPTRAVETPAAPTADRGVRLPTYAAAGAGLVLGAVGAFFGARTLGKWDDAKAQCDARFRCSREGLDRIDEARSSATLANVFVVASAATLSVSGYLAWRDLQPRIAIHERGLSFQGRF